MKYGGFNKSYLEFFKLGWGEEVFMPMLCILPIFILFFYKVP